MDNPDQITPAVKLAESPIPINHDELLFEELKATLLKEDREALQRLQSILDEPGKLSKKMSPVLEERLAVFKEAFPVEYKGIIETLISEKLANSKEELLEAIYPIIGKLIRRYIALQFKLLQEKIDQKMKFGLWHRVKSKFTSAFTGVDHDELILSDLMDVSIDNIFVIQKNSGLLIASTNDKNEFQDDVIAGMMTAIKSFAEDAFDRSGAELEEISYGHYQLLLESYYSYYFVVAVSSNISAQQSEMLHDKMNVFASQYLNRKKVKDGQFSMALSVNLKSFFFPNTSP